MKQYIIPLTLIIGVSLSANASAKSRYEKQYNQMQKFRLGSFTIDMVDGLSPTSKRDVDGIERLFFDNDTLSDLPFSRGFYPKMTVLTNQEHTTVTYSAQFKNKNECIQRIGHSEIAPFHSQTYAKRAIKKLPDEKVWVVSANRKISKQETIDIDEFPLVANGAYAKGYFNSLYPKSVGTFDKPQRGDFFFEMECKDNGGMTLTITDVSRHSEI